MPAKKKKRRVVECKKRKRRPRKQSAKEFFAEQIRELMDELERQYQSDTSNPAYYSAVTVVAGAFVWAIKRGCPPARLTSVMAEALEFALKTEGVPLMVMVEPPVAVDPKEVN